MKKFSKTGLPHDREAYVNLCKETTELAYSKKREFYTEILSKANSSKTLYSGVNKLLDNKQDVVLPSTKNDKELACDEKKPTILLLLGLSAALDTVDQKKLLTILKNEIQIEGTTLKWFKSFLIGRTQKVKINDSYSDIGKLLFGVAQGSILGPDLFNIYIRSLYPYIQPAHFSIFRFADDHQLMKSFVSVLQVKAFDDINRCLQMITAWVNDFFLCLNPTKTKILIIRPQSLRDSIILNGIKFKLLLLVHKCQIGQAPESLSTMLKFAGSTQTNKLEEG